MRVDPVTLEGKWVRLEPFRAEHAADLWKAAEEDLAIWRYIPLAPRNAAEMATFVAGALAMASVGQALPFVVRELAGGTLVGASGYWNIAPEHSRLEIGYTWLCPRAQRTGANTEMKYLMLEHAFEKIGCVRVEFKTDARNQRSRAALRRIGATEEGILRSHMAYADGSRRDSAYFSVLAPEWPNTKSHLEALAQR